MFRSAMMASRMFGIGDLNEEWWLGYVYLTMLSLSQTVCHRMVCWGMMNWEGSCRMRSWLVTLKYHSGYTEEKLESSK
jgi:hypothetical protein